MPESGWWTRLKGWLRADRGEPSTSGGWALDPLPAPLALAAVGGGIDASDDHAAANVLTLPSAAPETDDADADIDLFAGTDEEETPAEDDAEAVPEWARAPDPEWLDRLERMPERIADAVARSAAGAKELRRLAEELDGHRARSETVTGAVMEMTDLANRQANLVRETNTLLEQQNRLTEAVIDGLTGMRAAIKTVEETGHRHLACLDELERRHRRTLDVYQTILLGSQRRLGRLAFFAAVLGACALGGVGYLLYLNLGL